MSFALSTLPVKCPYVNPLVVINVNVAAMVVVSHYVYHIPFY